MASRDAIHRIPAAPTTQNVVPRLYDGDRMGREEFHRRYEAMGPGVRAELIEGIVYLQDHADMPSPVSLDFHATPHLDLSMWVGYYCSRTPGLLRGTDASVLLDGVNEPQPDVMLGIPLDRGGQTGTVTRNGKQYLSGGPDLVAEVSAATARVDLNAKRQAYARNGVREYLVLLTDRDPAEVRWMALDPTSGDFLPLPADSADRLLKSQVFPGLWLNAAALLSGDLAAVLVAVDHGCATDEHAAFLSSLQNV